MWAIKWEEWLSKQILHLIICGLKIQALNLFEFWIDFVVTWDPCQFFNVWSDTMVKLCNNKWVWLQGIGLNFDLFHLISLFSFVVWRCKKLLFTLQCCFNLGVAPHAFRFWTICSGTICNGKMDNGSFQGQNPTKICLVYHQHLYYRVFEILNVENDRTCKRKSKSRLLVYKFLLLSTCLWKGWDEENG